MSEHTLPPENAERLRAGATLLLVPVEPPVPSRREFIVGADGVGYVCRLGADGRWTPTDSTRACPYVAGDVLVGDCKRECRCCHRFHIPDTHRYVVKGKPRCVRVVDVDEDEAERMGFTPYERRGDLTYVCATWQLHTWWTAESEWAWLFEIERSDDA